MQRARKRYNMKGKYSAAVAKREFRGYKKSIGLTSDKNLERIKCESFITVRAINGGQYFVNQNSNVIWNTTEIQNTFTWIQLHSDFFKYKITGIAIRASPVHDDSDLADSACNFPMNVAFYPQYASYGVPAVEVMNNDNAFRVEPNISTPQTKYWHFPDGYFESSATGYGVWTATTSISSQIGELAIGNNPPFNNFGIDKSCYNLRVTYYITLGYKRC